MNKGFLINSKINVYGPARNLDVIIEKPIAFSNSFYWALLAGIWLIVGFNVITCFRSYPQFWNRSEVRFNVYRYLYEAI